MFLPRTALLLQKNLLPAVRCTICEVASKRMDTANIHLPDPSHFLLYRIPRHILFHISPKHKSSAFPPASQWTTHPSWGQSCPAPANLPYRRKNPCLSLPESYSALSAGFLPVFFVPLFLTLPFALPFSSVLLFLSACLHSMHSTSLLLSGLHALSHIVWSSDIPHLLFLSSAPSALPAGPNKMPEIRSLFPQCRHSAEHYKTSM